jgi:hypothetical protein
MEGLHALNCNSPNNSIMLLIGGCIDYMQCYGLMVKKVLITKLSFASALSCFDHL